MVYGRENCYYVSHSYDKQNPFNYALDIESHNSNTRMLRACDDAMRRMKKYFDLGYFYFYDIECKTACFELFTRTVC